MTVCLITNSVFNVTATLRDKHVSKVKLRTEVPGVSVMMLRFLALAIVSLVRAVRRPPEGSIFRGTFYHVPLGTVNLPLPIHSFIPSIHHSFHWG